MEDVRGCLILSRDGLVLGSYPASAEPRALLAWVRFATLGEADRGFVQLGAEMWCYVRRGAYAGFIVAGTGARPGPVLDHMDQALLVAEEGRARHELVRTADAGPVAPTSRPRAPLHADQHRSEDPLVIEGLAAMIGSREPADEWGPEHDPEGRGMPGPVPDAEGPSGSSPQRAHDERTAWGSRVEGEQDDVDRFSLAREFGRLLQGEDDPADG